MKLRPTTKLEWEVKDEGDAIVTTQPPQGDAFHLPASNTWWWRLIVCAGILLLLTSFIGVARLVNRAERNIAQTEREIELAVDADSFLRNRAAPKSQIQSIELQNDLAIVHMSVNEDVRSADKPVADETIYYHQSGGKWERVEANETARGPYRSQETSHLLFQYHQVDQSAVEAVVPTIEAFTTDLHRDIGLDQPPILNVHFNYESLQKLHRDMDLYLPPVHEKVIVTIDTVASMQPLEPTYLVGYIIWESDGIVVLSPQLARSSTTLASSDTLSQAIKSTVAYRTILLAVDKEQPQAVWRPVVDGMQLWAYSTYREFDADLANNMNSLLRQRLANKVPLRLPDLPIVPPSLINTQESPDIRWQQSVLAKSVIDYAIATYGRRSLARLLDGMHQYDSWQTLVPAVFGVSTEEFESGWQAYLSAQYNLYP